MQQTAENVYQLNQHRPVVKADIENGFDRLAHELTNALAKNDAKLSGCEFQIVFALIGKTYRYHKKSDWVANIQLCQLTGMSKSHVSKTLKSLIEKNIVFKNGREIGINPTVSEWKVNQSVNNKKLTNQLTAVNQSVDAVNQSVNKSCPIRPPQKKTNTTKETITKEYIVSRFEKFWSLYPNKTGKKKCLDHFLKNKPDDNRFEEMINGLQNQIDWRASAPQGTWLPNWKNPLTWLNGEHWEDTLQPHSAHTSQNYQHSKSKATPENFSEKDYGDIQVRF